MIRSILIFALIVFVLPSLCQHKLIRDLDSSSLDLFIVQASEWLIEDDFGVVKDTPVITDCELAHILGGFNVGKTGVKMTKTYHDLPPHDTISFQIVIYYLDEWDDQSVNIHMDSTSFTTSSVTWDKWRFKWSLCGNDKIDDYLIYFGTLPHLQSDLTVKIDSNLHQSTDIASWGIVDFSIIVHFSGSTESSICIPETFYYNVKNIDFCMCDLGEYIDHSALKCVPCAQECKGCIGPTQNDCYNCDQRYSLRGQEGTCGCPPKHGKEDDSCQPCKLEGCSECIENVDECDVCLDGCDECDNEVCTKCTPPLLLYEGDCFEICPTGWIPDSVNGECITCQNGCLDCIGRFECLECISDTQLINGLCLCSEENKFYVTGFGCTGVCSNACSSCISSEYCLACETGTTLTDKYCKCDNDGFFYKESLGCVGECPEHCTYCRDTSYCFECSTSSNRDLLDGKCKCPSPKVLVGTECKCPPHMNENPDTLECEMHEFLNIAFQPIVSAHANVVLQAIIDPNGEALFAPFFTWTVICNYSSSNDQLDLDEHVETQTTKILLIPTNLLSFNLICTVSCSYFTQNWNELTKQIQFSTWEKFQPQIHLRGAPLQILSHSKTNILSATLLPVDWESTDSSIEWIQLSGKNLDITSFPRPSQLSFVIPKCKLSMMSSYTFQVQTSGLGPSIPPSYSQIVVNVPPPELIARINNGNRTHFYAEDLHLEAIMLVEDQCMSSNINDFVDMTTAEYIWECYNKDPNIDSESLTACPNSLNIFYNPSTSSSITIPNSVFGQSNTSQIIFSLTITVNANPANIQTNSLFPPFPNYFVLKSETYISITNSTILTNTLSCFSQNNCKAVTSTFGGWVFASLVDPNLLYDVDSSDSWITVSMFYYKMEISARYYFLNQADDQFFQIYFTMTSSTESIQNYFRLPLVQQPINGFLEIFPLTGETFSTSFFINTYGWIGENIPLSFQFFLAIEEESPAPIMILEQFNPYIFTKLISPPFSSIVYLGVIIKNNLGVINMLNSSVTVNGGPNSLSDSISIAQRILDKQSNNDILEDFILLASIIENIVKWEDLTLNPTPSEQFLSAEIKLKLLMRMISIYNLSTENTDMRRVLLQSIKDSSKNPFFNQNKNWEIYQDAIDLAMETAQQGILYHKPETASLLYIIDQLITYMKVMKNPVSTPEKIAKYFDIVSKSDLHDQVTDLKGSGGGTWSLIRNFDYVTTKVSLCQMTIDTLYRLNGNSPGSPGVSFKPLPGVILTPEDCMKEINIIYIAFPPDTIYNNTLEQDLWNPSPIKYKNMLALDVREVLTGEVVLIFEIIFNPAQLGECPGGCGDPGTGNTDPSEGIGVFDIIRQITKIFQKSEIEKVTNITILASFQFWKSGAFWVAITLIVWFSTSFYFLKFKLANYCLLEQSRNNLQNSHFLWKVGYVVLVTFIFGFIHFQGNASSNKHIFI